MSEVNIPENVEEIIAAYLKQQSNRFPKHLKPAMISVDISPTTLKVCGWITGCDVPASTRDTLESAINEHLEKISKHDPIVARKDEIEKLRLEVAKLEAEAIEAGGAK